MKSRIFCLQMILCLFAFLGNGQGQGCGGWMTPHYSVYSTLRRTAQPSTRLYRLMDTLVVSALSVVPAPALPTPRAGTLPG